ncbi:hypothetical protein [uncultured Thiothrix sp.]|nr:hypothetical protein [uncultured Thiothrix sp.]
MSFLIEVKFKNGKVQKVTIRADVASDAIAQIYSLYNDVASYKFLK